MKKRYLNRVLDEEKLSSGEQIFVIHSIPFGIASQGKTKKEALKNFKEAIFLYLEEINN